MKNAGNSSIQSILRKPCWSGMLPLAPKNLKKDNSFCLNPTATLLDKNRRSRGALWGTSLHVSFPDSRPFGHPMQTYNPSRITSSISRWAPYDARGEKISFFHNARRNGQIKSSRPVRLENPSNQSSPQDFWHAWLTMPDVWAPT